VYPQFDSLNSKCAASWLQNAKLQGESISEEILRKIEANLVDHLVDHAKGALSYSRDPGILLSHLLGQKNYLEVIRFVENMKSRISRL
jgi:hypothetical protein